MKEIIRIGKLMFSQQSAINLELSLTDLLIISYINDFIETGKCEMIEENNFKYYYIAYHKILTDLPIIKIKKRQFLRTLEVLISKNIIVPLNKNVGRKKTFFRLNLSQVKNSKYIIDDDLFVIKPTLPAPDIDFYLSWFGEWFKNINNKNEITEDIKNKFLNLAKRISTESYIKINNQNVSASEILKALINLFKADEDSVILKLKELFYNIECTKNINNKYKYTITILYNEAISI